MGRGVRVLNLIKTDWKSLLFSIVRGKVDALLGIFRHNSFKTNAIKLDTVTKLFHLIIFGSMKNCYFKRLAYSIGENFLDRFFFRGMNMV